MSRLKVSTITETDILKGFKPNEKKLPAWQENNNNIEKLKRTSIINDDIVWPGKNEQKPKKIRLLQKVSNKRKGTGDQGELKI